MSETYKSGYISVVGKTNAGKSSLVNVLVGQKVSIVTPKSQTTRNNILGIMNGENYQYIFIDTPGIHNTKSHLDKYMMKSVRSAMDGVDLLLYVIDGTKNFYEEEIEYISGLTEKTENVIVVVTKIDKTKPDQLYPNLAKLNSVKGVKDIVCVSSVTKKNIDELLKVIDKYMPESDSKEFIYEDDMFTDKSVRFLVAEIIREKVLLRLNEEIPHGVAVEIKKFEEKDNITDILVDLICERQAHKTIIIGKQGQTLKWIGEQARKDIEDLLDKKVMLRIWVRDRKNWRNDTNFLNEIGYSSEEI